jgi:hypothetical protein
VSRTSPAEGLCPTAGRSRRGIRRPQPPFRRRGTPDGHRGPAPLPRIGGAFRPGAPGPGPALNDFLRGRSRLPPARPAVRCSTCVLSGPVTRVAWMTPGEGPGLNCCCPSAGRGPSRPASQLTGGRPARGDAGAGPGQGGTAAGGQTPAPPSQPEPPAHATVAGFRASPLPAPCRPSSWASRQISACATDRTGAPWRPCLPPAAPAVQATPSSHGEALLEAALPNE